MNNYLYLIGEDTDKVFSKAQAVVPNKVQQHFPFTMGVSLEDPPVEYSKLILFHSEREAPWPVQYFVDMMRPYDKEGEPIWNFDLANNPEYLGQLLILKKDLELTKRKISQLVTVPNRAILDSTHDEPAIKELCKYVLTHFNIEFLFSYLKLPKEDDAA
jgi:hypothetical protein